MTDRRTWVFIAVTFLISWGTFAMGKWASGPGAPGVPASMFFMLGPAAAALLLRRRMGLAWHDLGIVRRGINWKWMAAAILIAAVLPLLTLFFNWLFGEVMHGAVFGHTALSKDMFLSNVEQRMAQSNLDADHIESSLARLSSMPINGAALMIAFSFIGALAGGIINLPFTLGEELGWRGMLLHFTRHKGLWPHVLFTGIVWGLWHAPLILQGHNYPEHRWAGVFFMCLLTIGLALPMVWVRVRGGCIWAAGVLHGAVNGTAGTTLLFTRGGSDLAGGAVGISALCALVVIGSLLFLIGPHFRRAFIQ